MILATTELFTLGSLATYSGSSLAVILVTNTLSIALKLKKTPPWLGLIVSIVICVAAQLLTPVAPDSSTPAPSIIAGLFLAVLNAFLIYATAFGGNAIVVGANEAYTTSVRDRPLSFAPGSAPRPEQRFFRNWFSK
jgi:uncharacterized membrane protein YvlD (DUF360 family)